VVRNDNPDQKIEYLLSFIDGQLSGIDFAAKTDRGGDLYIRLRK
jgi:hypothetical protein